ncbi:MAG: glycosyltransferase family 61 protein [Methylacidiphilaceae bacterium]|nr:glycosyltransferase family 61 protein [Candidatus Methylacidiphilaceae bacterium]
MSGATARRNLGIFVNRFIPWATPLLEFVYIRLVRRACVALIQCARKAIPTSSERFGPPKGVVVTMPEWIERDAKRGRILSRSRENKADLRADPEPEAERGSLPESGSEDNRRELRLVELYEARVCTENGAILGRDDRLIAEVTPRDPWFDCNQHEVLLRLRLPRINRQAKRAACVYTHPALAHNYGHWLFECVSKLGALKESYGWESFDQIVVNRIDHPFQDESLRLAGIPREKMMELDHRLHLKAESLVASSYVAYASKETPKWVCDAVRRLILPEKREAEPRRKIYLTRKHANRRKLIDEEEVVRLLGEYGFEEVVPEKLSLSEQAALFDESKWVIGLYGAALCNLVFCRPGSLLLELHVAIVPNCNYYKELAGTCAVRYERVEAKPVSYQQGRGAYYADVRIDIEELEQKLRSLESGSV